MKSHKNHILLMILGCVIPLMLLFFAPFFGINSTVSIFLFVIIMLGFHLLFPMHGQNHEHHSDSDSTENNNN